MSAAGPIEPAIRAALLPSRFHRLRAAVRVAEV
jgi:hypothetical protein